MFMLYIHIHTYIYTYIYIYIYIYIYTKINHLQEKYFGAYLERKSRL